LANADTGVFGTTELALAGTANSVDESGAASANALFGAPAGAVAGAANGKLAEFEIDFGGAQQAIKLDKDFSSVGSSKENSAALVADINDQISKGDLAGKIEASVNAQGVVSLNEVKGTNGFSGE